MLDQLVVTVELLAFELNGKRQLPYVAGCKHLAKNAV